MTISGKIAPTCIASLAAVAFSCSTPPAEGPPPADDDAVASSTVNICAQALTAAGEVRPYQLPLVCCGDGVCQSGETSSNCPSDCGTQPYCGDGACNGGETRVNCSTDCGYPLNDVGVIPATLPCPASSETIRIHMDDEDADDFSQVNGWVGATNTDNNGAGGNMNFYFCRVDGTRFHSLGATNSPGTNYAVLKLGMTCPDGAVEFVRFFDNEDDNNSDSYSGNIYPNVVAGNTSLHFCLFKGDGTISSSLPNLGFDYGVFAGPGFWYSSYPGYIITNDEETNNIDGYQADPAWRSAAVAIVSDWWYTRLYTVRALP